MGFSLAEGLSPLEAPPSLYPPPPSAGSRKVNVIRGLSVETDSTVRLLTGPVVGEVTAQSAVILLEVQAEARTVPIGAAIYAVRNRLPTYVPKLSNACVSHYTSSGIRSEPTRTSA